MVGNKTISAVLFVYNEEKFLSQMVSSIQRQTVSVDDIIIVDDQSNDGTKEIIESLQAADKRIRYYFNPEKGKIHAYQLGLSKVETDLFFVSAGDDVLFDDFVESLFFDSLIRHNIQYTYAHCTVVNASLTPLATEQKKPFYITDELLEANQTNGYLFGYASILKDILPLPPALQFEDWYTAVKLSALFGKNYLSDRPLFYYRKHGASATTLGKSRSKYINSAKRNVIFYKALLESQFLSPEQLKKVKYLLLYYEALAVYSVKTVGAALVSGLSLKQKIRICVNPLWVAYHYTEN